MQVHFLQVLPLPTTTDEVSFYSFESLVSLWSVHICAMLFLIDAMRGQKLRTSQQMNGIHTHTSTDRLKHFLVEHECVRVIHAYAEGNTSLCVGMNFQGIPSATSALNWTTISLVTKWKFIRHWEIRLSFFIFLLIQHKRKANHLGLGCRRNPSHTN